MVRICYRITCTSDLSKRSSAALESLAVVTIHGILCVTSRPPFDKRSEYGEIFTIAYMGEIESSDDNTLIIKADITVSVLYIAMDQFLWRPVRRTPLIWITVLCHEVSCNAVYLHNPVEVPLCRMPDCHKMIPDLLVFYIAIRSFIHSMLPHYSHQISPLCNLTIFRSKIIVRI